MKLSAEKSIYPCLWFDNQAQEAAQYYCSIFKNARLISDNGLVVMFEINDSLFMGLNGGPQFKFNESISFVVSCDGQEEVDYHWDSFILSGGVESQCGWLKDKYGISWQIVPQQLRDWIGHPQKEKRDYALNSMLKMKKIIIQDLIQPI
jgi:predicted 3-demethylubiquinone-9 3-methyltransferase (glyoxalase superfamily)